jgi:cytochrome c553
MKGQMLIFLSILLAFSCAKKEEDSTTTNQPVQELELPPVSTARQNIEAVCYVCHSPNQGPDERIAPPLEIPKRNYLASTNSRDEFVDKMVQFILNPTAQQSLMHSDVEQYGLMDPVGFSEQEVREIAEYIYDNDLERPDWLIKE